MTETVFFFMLAGASMVSGVLVVVQRNAVASAISLIITLLSLAGVYLLLQAPFIAVIQVLVYAGAIMVLFLFVIMLLNPDKEKRETGRVRLAKAVGVGMGIVLLAQLGIVFSSLGPVGPAAVSSGAAAASPGNTEAVSRLLFTDYLLPFEITSVLLLVAIIGAIILAKREV